MKATKKAVIGRRVVDVKFRPFRDGRGGLAHDPRIVLDDGRELYFEVEETGVGEYGVKICITEPKRIS